MLAPQWRDFQRAFTRVAAQPALLQAVRQQSFGQLAGHVVAALGPVQAAVGQAGGGGWFVHTAYRKAHRIQPGLALSSEQVAGSYRPQGIVILWTAVAKTFPRPVAPPSANNNSGKSAVAGARSWSMRRRGCGAQPSALAPAPPERRPPRGRPACSSGAARAARTPAAPPPSACPNARWLWQILPQYLFVDKQQCTQSLPVGGCQHLAIVGEQSAKRVDLGLPHFPRMTKTMKADKPAHPVDMRLLGAQAVMQVTQAFAHLAQQMGGLWCRGSRKIAEFGRGINTVHINNFIPTPNKFKPLSES